MQKIPITPLEKQITQNIGLVPGTLTRELLYEWQLKKIKETLSYAKANSPFYRRLLSDISPYFLNKLSDLSKIPFTASQDIRDNPMDFLCVSQGEISRVVTLQTSGTSQQPKRIFFSESDLEATVDFFHHGISTMVEPGWKVFICMPGELPGSVGDLLIKGLARMNVEGILHGIVIDPELALKEIEAHKVDCVVGIPVQILSLVRKFRENKHIKSVLLCADYIPKILVKEIREAWGCEVFQHYGMTEGGLGGGVECRAFDGYHMREDALFF